MCTFVGHIEKSGARFFGGKMKKNKAMPVITMESDAVLIRNANVCCCHVCHVVYDIVGRFYSFLLFSELLLHV